ncbi:MAG: hypothetical protein AAF902_21080 [Chloroflexota bacterium]
MLNKRLLTFFLLLTGFAFIVFHITNSTAQSDASSTDLIFNGSFDEGLDGWESSSGDPSPTYYNPDTGSVFLPDPSYLMQIISVPYNGIFELTAFCSNSESLSDTDLSVNFHRADVTSDENSTSEFLNCEGGQIQERLVLEQGNFAIILSFHNSGVLELDDVSLTSTNFVDIDTGLIRNGDFIGRSEWRSTFSIQDNDRSGFLIAEGNSEIGSFQVESGSIIQEGVIVTSNDFYTLSVHCKVLESAASGIDEFFIVVDGDNGVYADHGLMPCADSVSTLFLYLPAGIYTITLGTYSEPHIYRFDDVSLESSNQQQNIDTGYIVNGDFIGQQGWDGWQTNELSGALFEPIMYSGNYFWEDIFDNVAPGSVFLPVGEKISQQDQIQLPFDGKYTLSFSCVESNAEVEVQVRMGPEEFTTICKGKIDTKLELPAGFHSFEIMNTAVVQPGDFYDKLAFLDDVALKPVNLIKNGDFTDNLADWSDLGNTPVLIDSGSAYLDDSELEQNNIIIPAHGMYELSFKCTAEHQYSSLIYILYNETDKVGTPLNQPACGTETLVSEILSLVPGTYYIYLIGQEIFLDDVALRESAAYVDLDTGLIKNGDFIGTEGWQIESDRSLIFISDDGATSNGAAIDSITQKDIVIEQAGTYTLTFYCHGNESKNSNSRAIFLVPRANPQGGFSTSYRCQNQTESFEISLVEGQYDLLMVIGGAQDNIWVDDISLFLKEAATPTATSTPLPTETPTETPQPTSTTTPTVTPDSTSTATTTTTPTATSTSLPTVAATLTMTPTSIATAAPAVTPVHTETPIPITIPTLETTQTATPTQMSSTTKTPQPTQDPSEVETQENQHLIFLPLILR